MTKAPSNDAIFWSHRDNGRVPLAPLSIAEQAIDERTTDEQAIGEQTGDKQAIDEQTGDEQADVVIVGGGFTGLWTAYHLKRLAPEKDIRVLEARRFGHGASGRNGGWVVGNLAGLERHLKGLTLARRQALCELLSANVDEIGATLSQEGIDADFHKGGALYAAARYPAQEALQRDYLAHLLALGHRQHDCRWLSADELSDRARFRRPFGGIFHRQVATLHPGKLIDGLVARLAAMQVRLYEQSPATSIDDGKVTTPQGSIRAPMIVMATEGYNTLPQLRPHLVPVSSLVIATEPLSQSQWDAIGLAQRPTFADASRLINYGHRSRDGRLIFGARGRYRFNARPRHQASITQGDIQMRKALLQDLFPDLGEVDISHGWGGTLGLSRSFRPHALVDRRAGIATAGGYAGEGVAASHLMARTLAEMLCGQDTPLTRAPWAFDGCALDQVVRRWEPEPLRWLGAQTITLSYATEEALASRERHLPLIGPALSRLNDRFAAVIE
ncbi:FAD-binding oxidoreductase [Halomonas sp. SCS19]|uniref:NAD(P)/FAD-dependent oxidoreductase n=1 Tax=Halomonas sp. SCS19 TaxID=2950870 RepID=UPI0032DF239C